MHFDGFEGEIGIGRVDRPLQDGWRRHIRNARRATRRFRPGSATRSRHWRCRSGSRVDGRKYRAPSRRAAAAPTSVSGCGRSFLPRAGVVQEAGVPFRPAISTRHRRQEPKASRLSVAQSLGIGLSIRAAAAITEVPGGTLTLRPSMVSVTVGAPARIGVPVSSSCNRAMAGLLFRCGARRRLGEILAEMIERAEDGHRGEPA